eukprot:7376175-Prymnesium_polylepis.1
MRYLWTSARLWLGAHLWLRASGLGEGGQCGMRRLWGGKRATMMQGGGEVQTGPSGTATPA